MAMIRLYSATVIGIHALPVTVEVTRRGGREVGMVIVGLADTAVKESRERVYSALKQARFQMPPETIIVNLAPGDLRKEGSGFDLPIALAVLSADGMVARESFAGCVIIGELGLDGSVRPVRGILPVVVDLKSEGFHTFVVPRENAHEASIVDGIEVLPVAHLLEAVAHFRHEHPLNPLKWVDTDLDRGDSKDNLDMADVRGHTFAKRALEVAAAGGHNVLMVGPPGAGKTMLARRVPTILPSMTREEAVETTRVHSVAGLVDGKGLVRFRPFRAPHHTISHAGLVGGGTVPRPGEISLAHNGVLFLDEFPEFHRSALEVLREPLESRKVTVARAAMTLTFPAGFMLIAAMNPCPCGFFGSPHETCHCAPGMMIRYRRKISGPLLERIDVHLEIPLPSPSELMGKSMGESSSVIRLRVEKARQFQRERYKGLSVRCNADLDVGQIDRYCFLTTQAKSVLEKVIRHKRWSARTYHRIIKLGRTIADLEECDVIQDYHVAEAVQYRSFDLHGPTGAF